MTPDNNQQIRILHTDGRNGDFIKLCRLLDQNLDEIVGGAFQRAVYDQYNQLDDIHDTVLIYENNTAAACGSFKAYSDEEAEVKRVFVRKEYRGKGFSRLIMNELENKARELGFLKMILETGAPLKAAMGLYRSLGYELIKNYGQYRDMKDSVCMEKPLYPME